MVLPNIQSAVLGSAFLTLALVLGEVILSRLLLYNTLPVEMISIGDAGTAGVPVALSIESLVFTWGLLLLISFLGRRGGRSRPPRPTNRAPDGPPRQPRHHLVVMTADRLGA